MAQICVVGAGPAGSIFAARMAQFGHDVVLIERACFPRSHLGESLSPGVLPLLEAVGARAEIEEAGFWRVHNVHVKWNGGPDIREDPREQGLLVERGRFDQLLLQHAQAMGVRVLQPAYICRQSEEDGGWTIELDLCGRSVSLRADFLADARGRSASRGRRRIAAGCRTLALYAYWRGPDLPKEPRIEAGPQAWYWGVPLPDGTYNTLVFLDPKHCRGGGTSSLPERFLQLLDRSCLLAGCSHPDRVGPVRATDATPYLDSDSVTPSRIKVGEAALALDPLSSSGVQKAIQTALAAAIVSNTLLRRSSATEAALAFYKTMLTNASERHRRWAAGHYRSAAMGQESSFWRDRALPAESDTPSGARTPIDAQALSRGRVRLSGQLAFVQVPCLDQEFVTVRPALEHPDLEGPVAYLGGAELSPLLQDLPAGFTPLQIAQLWSSKMSRRSALAIVAWLMNNGLLVQDLEVSTTEGVDVFDHGLAELARS